MELKVWCAITLNDTDLEQSTPFLAMFFFGFVFLQCFLWVCFIFIVDVLYSSHCIHTCQQHPMLTSVYAFVGGPMFMLTSVYGFVGGPMFFVVHSKNTPNIYSWRSLSLYISIWSPNKSNRNLCHSVYIIFRGNRVCWV